MKCNCVIRGSRENATTVRCGLPGHIVLSVCNGSVILLLEILSLYWDSLLFRGGSIVALPIRFKRRVGVLRCAARLLGEAAADTSG